MIKAIVYTTNTGSAAWYAKMLGGRISLPVFCLDEAKRRVPRGAEIIYLGWVMASQVKGYAKAAKRFCVKAVCAVGMTATGSSDTAVREKNRIPAETPVFLVRGNFQVEKLRGLYRLMMGIMIKSLEKALQNPENQTAEEQDMLDMLLHGQNRVSAENLKNVLDWYGAQE